MKDPRRERRNTESQIRNRPRPSPANVLVITVIGVLGAMAVAAAVFGGGLEETTPHGQVLTSLQRVADAQEQHHRETGAFARSLSELDVTPSDGVRIDLVRGGPDAWEAIAGHPIGLTCMQGGRYDRRTALRDQPLCFTDP
jgi:hypothetical protein